MVKTIGGSSGASFHNIDSKAVNSIKDSDSGTSTSTATPKKEPGVAAAATTKKTNNALSSPSTSTKVPRKRGRPPGKKSEEPRTKKFKDDLPPQRNPFLKPPMRQLKETGESFLQDGPCFKVAPKLIKCRDCRWVRNQRSMNMLNILCRFYAFRKLHYTKKGHLAIAGFSDTHKDAMEDDLKLWLPSPEAPPSDLHLSTARFILKHLGDEFCKLLRQEQDALNEHMSEDMTIAWKRVVGNAREMCDVCNTTLFNIHWTCGVCGFVVCLDCYMARKSGKLMMWSKPGKDSDDFTWLLCTNRQPHEQENLMLTQIIAGDCLQKLGRIVHVMRELWDVEQHCDCAISKEVTATSNNKRKEIIKSILAAELNTVPDVVITIKQEENIHQLLAEKIDGEIADGAEEKPNGGVPTATSHKTNDALAGSPVQNNGARMDTLHEVILIVIDDCVPKQEDVKGNLGTLTESQLPHSWLCDGRLLRLSDTTHAGNFQIFQDQWKRGQPVLVTDVNKHLNQDLWTPDAFSRDFGDEVNDLVNYMNGRLVENQLMRKFWAGFEHSTKRLTDEKGNPMLLKLKDWPAVDDFAEMMPSRFNDLMQVLPLAEYTHRNGKLNLTSRLPDCFVRPDLGPKMYIAYGSALYPSKGTTNLHLDMSDAVNMMAYVGIPKDGDTDEHIEEALRSIDEADCDFLMRRRVRDNGELPGALWHIYNARDVDKIRDLLNKVVLEKGGVLDPHDDPIHDQSFYLDGPLRQRLYKEYGVEGYAIVQCLGDAIFIPAGAPHQVRNLHNCIKVAQDFVSPENVSHCFHLTQEFRDLSDTHSNHEDKLQIKNMILHAIKDALSVLTAIFSRHVKIKTSGRRRSHC